MVKFKKFMVALLSGAMLLGMVTSAESDPTVNSYAAEENRETAEIKVSYNFEYFAPGRKSFIYANAYDQNGSKVYNDTFTWSVEGATKLWSEDAEGEPTEEYTYLKNEWSSGDEVCLHIGTKEPLGTKITLTVRSNSKTEISASYTAVVAKKETVKIEFEDGWGNKDVESCELGEGIEVRANIYAGDGTLVWDDILTWEVEGAPEWTDDLDDKKQTYFEERDYLWLSIGTEEQIGKKIIVKATSQNNPSISTSWTITVCGRIATDIYMNTDHLPESVE